MESTLKSHALSQERNVPHAKRWQLLWHQRAVTVCLIVFDAGMLNIGFLLAFYIRFNLLTGRPVLNTGVNFVPVTLALLRPFQVGFVASMLALIALRGMYRLRLTGTIWRQLGILLNAAFAGFALYSIYEYVVRPFHLGLDDNTRAFVAFAWLAAIIAPFVGRLLLSCFLTICYQLGVGQQRVLVIGSGKAAKIVMQHLASIPSLGLQVVGFVNDHPTLPSDFGRFKVLGHIDDLESVLRSQHIGETIIALPSSNQGAVTRCARICERNGVGFRFLPDLQEFSLAQLELEDVGGLPLFELKKRAGGVWQHRVKRVLDMIGAALILGLGLPLWLVIALLIRLDSPGLALYRQTRIGRYGRPFTTFKFRSMYSDADARRSALTPHNHAGRGLFKLKDDPRCTRMGRLLRRTSLDEIPQLINVWRGDMSLVGPRPPLPDEFARYEEWEKRRLEMTPGLTGLWQVRGRSDIVFEEMVLMDLYYIENWSLLLDIQILLKTMPAVLFARGAY